MKAYLLTGALMLGGSYGAARAQVGTAPPGAGGGPRSAVAQAETTHHTSGNITTTLDDALGQAKDPGGFRAFLSTKGISYSLTYIAETLGNPIGGQRQGAIYEGRLGAQLDADLDKFAGWKGATFHTSAFQIHGTGLTRYYVGNLMDVSGIEALPSTRLFELWFEQKTPDGMWALKFGQIGIGTEFLVSQTATLFMNTTFDWPEIATADLPSGGPAYPFAAPAVRLKYAPNRNLSFLVGVFDGDPAGPARPGEDPEPQRRNRTNTNFRTSDPALLIAQGSYAYNLDEGATAEPGVITLGYWHHFGRFNDQRLDTAGRSLADPSSTGIARRLRGNDGIYAIVDQTLFREAGKSDEGLSAFARVSASPSDRNLVDLYVDAGLAYKGLIEGRPKDTVGLSVAYTRISSRVSDLDRDTILASGSPMPRRNFEAVIEATYQAVIAPGITVQPDVQYIFHLGGNTSNTRDLGEGRIRNAVVLGLRTTIRY
ncbi:carbohydrate porin [Methylobacterium sp. NMS12]|uniref:carbohydrate porin n=1 Tax=Methylobacterium sp. NMS12 TaxID=3079766 RepID=UPI003F884ECF